ncbi:MAG: tRNA (adenosine(37)-N6)-dimethylallyltransferase MiaA [Gammaproteobacteria bacterium]|nr:tRNA (adenosine(37)-N6)-dimethylallyltransferase MiaA [Gammaproteobacteria bacterium]
MDIGTAKPGPEVLAAAPHRLLDICDPAEVYSAGRFREDARREVGNIHAAGRIPLLVGGTGLYFRAFEQGLAAMPGASYQLRRRLAAEAWELGWAALHARLATVDPDSAARIHPNDPQRLQRALEVYELTGRPLSAYAGTKARLNPDPHRLDQTGSGAGGSGGITASVQRPDFQAMLEAGLVDEVSGLYNRGDLDASLPSMRMVGYRQIWRYLDGQLDYERHDNACYCCNASIGQAPTDLVSCRAACALV